MSHCIDPLFGEQPALILRYVPHSRVAAYERAGWTDLGEAPGPHGHYAHIFEWRELGEPSEPADEESQNGG